MSAFRFEYDPPVVRSGVDSAADLGAELAAQDIDRALVVCGSTVGSTPAVIDPVREGLGDRLAGVFAETSPQKRLGTAAAASEALRERDADAFLALGGGSSLDVATVAAVLAGGVDAAAAGDELAATGTVPMPDGDLPPVVAVPTTLAGAELSQVAGITATPESGLVDEPVSGGVSDPRLMPRAVVYDPSLVATTPESVLTASAMNGFDKGVETLYASTATPVTDATAVRGLSLLADALPRLGEDADAETLTPVLEGTLLVQYGISRPGETTLSLIHAFGHGLTDAYEIQQGVAHGVVAPHALDYLFAEVDGRRDLLAEALGVDDSADPAAAVVDAVADVRDGLGLPDRLSDLEEPDPGDFRAIAQRTLDDSFMGNAPPGLDPTVEDLVGVLEAAY